jgi:chitin disaccharide deacetylase
MTASPDERPCLIVNADDYGYFRCVSKGILKSATDGVVTATGVFANTNHFGEHAAWLRDCDALDAGVHLNLTDGTPLTSDLQKMLLRWSGRFPRKFAMAKAILSGAIKVDAVQREWRAQIERCLEHGLKLSFLNSHEHMHMLPSLFPVAKALARDYDIRHIRFPKSRLAGSMSRGSLFRSAVIKVLETVNRRHMNTSTAHFLGLEASGKLDMQYLQETVSRLRAGRIYELMCHPGDFDPQEVSNPRLLRYHDWQGELRTLTSPALRELLDRRGVRLIGYRHLEVRDDRLVARQEPVNRPMAT